MQRLCVPRNVCGVEFTLADLYEEPAGTPTRTRAADLCEEKEEWSAGEEETTAGTSPAASPQSDAGVPLVKAISLCSERSVLLDSIPGPDFVQLVHDLLGDFTQEEYRVISPLRYSGRLFELKDIIDVYREAWSRR
jgi:hypothetical protein